MFSKKNKPPANSAPAGAPGKPAAEAKPPVQTPAKKGGFGSPFGKKKVEGSPPAKSPVTAPAPKPTGSAKPPTKAKGGSPLTLLIPLLAILALVGGAYFAYSKFIAPSSGQKPAAQALANVPTAEPNNADSLVTAPKAATKKKKQATETQATDPNAVNSGGGAAGDTLANCETAPKFITKLGLQGSATFDVSEAHRLVLLVPVPDSDALSKYQNQSWNEAGLVGAFALDREGNLYVAPSPRLGAGIKAAKPQNVIYKVDSDTGNLRSYVTLPDAKPPSPENPFGIVGLAYDCGTNSLYVSSLAGSTAAQEAGHIYRVDLNLGAVAGRMDNVDALGLTVGRGANGSVLYFGSARTPQLRAVNLDAAGDFDGAPRDAGALTGTQRALRLSLASPKEMMVQEGEFDLANPDTPQGTPTRFQYDLTADQWNPVQ